jgi:hypothetical protein
LREESLRRGISVVLEAVRVFGRWVDRWIDRDSEMDRWMDRDREVDRWTDRNSDVDRWIDIER